MSSHPDRRPGCLYVVLEGERHVSTEDHAGVFASAGRNLREGRTRLLEFPDPAAHEALTEWAEWALVDLNIDTPVPGEFSRFAQARAAARAALALARGEEVAS